MSFFKTREEKELDAIISKMEMNMSNNYKDAAQSDLKDLESAIDVVRSAGKMKAAKLEIYERALSIYKERLKGFTHKDQKPYWT